MQIRTIRTFLLTLFVLTLSAASFAQIRVSVSFGPPPIPVYEQPLCPGEGYIWTPGYWAYGDDFDDYYWVPGTWVLAPEVGFLWTPGYWAWNDGAFVFYEGYWSPQIGFYGGINYGFGYFGEGYEGGRWDHDRFLYNRSVTNVNVTVIHNVYNETVVNNTNVSRVSYNGGNGGITARPTPQQEGAVQQRHIAPVAAQTQHMQEARSNPQQRASMNQGKPQVAATARPGDFKGSGVVQAKEAGGAYTPRAGNSNAKQPRQNGSPASHARDLPPVERQAAPNTGNPKMDKKYQQQQEKQHAAQEKERQKLQQQQEKEDQMLAKQNADEARKQQVEQRHQQQTQQLQQRHEQQRQQMQQRMQPPPERGSERRPPQ
jgi:hypothetical protein